MLGQMWFRFYITIKVLTQISPVAKLCIIARKKDELDIQINQNMLK